MSTESATILTKAKRSRDWSVGLFFLLCVVILWVLSSVLLNDLFEKDIYSKPFLITWINTASFSLYLIPYYISLRRKRTKNTEDTVFNAANEGQRDDEYGSIDDNSDLIVDPNSEPLSFKQTVILAFWFCALWFLSNLVNNASLIYTSMSSQTILSSTSSFFTIIIGYLFHIESINSVKLGSIVVSFLGVVLVTNNDEPVTNKTRDCILLGNLLALSGALCYGVYSILLKLKVKDDSRINMKLFFGFVGVFNLLFLWPPIVIMHKLGYEKFELPKALDVYCVLGFNCFISFLADFLWARAMLLTSPLTVTVGLSLTIPVAMACDFVFKHKINSFIYMFGAVLICLSFYFVNKNEQEDDETIQP